MQKAILDIAEIKGYFPFHRKCLVKVLILLVNCMMLANSCNLNKLKKKGSIALGEPTNIETVYTRFIRWFRMANTDLFTFGILQLIFNILSPYICSEGEVILSMDRTNWKLGSVNINILMLGLVLENGKFIPLYFELLDKRGNSNQEERKELMKVFKTLFSLFIDTSFSYRLVLTADRVPIAIGIIGKKWFYYLKNAGYEFVIRVRKTDYKELLAKQMNISVLELDHKIRGQIAAKKYFSHPIIIEGKPFYYVATWAKDKKQDKDAYIRFLSTQQDITWVCTQYDKRWKIEVFFEDTKEKGFRLEQINFKNLEKVRLMVAVTSLCYALCIQQGIVAYEKRPPKLKLDKPSNKYYYRVSIFTKGYEIIEQVAFSVNSLNLLINNALKEKIKPNIRPFMTYILNNLSLF